MTDDHNTESAFLEPKFIFDVKKSFPAEIALFRIRCCFGLAITDLMLNRQDAFREGVKKVIFLRT